MKYTCPMHPEVIRDQPGPCPICGMDLEPILENESDLEQESKKEYQFWSKRFWTSVIFTLPVLILAMFELGYLWVQFILTSIVVFWCGATLYERAWHSIQQRKLNMFSLIAMGTGVAYIYSVVALFFPDIFPNSFKENGELGTYFEATAVIIMLVLLGQLLEARARSKTGSALRALIKQSPKTALRIDQNGEHEINIDEVQVGDKLRVLSGQKVPVDGIILEGTSHIDESMLTGESKPVKKEPGDNVAGGTINQEGSLIMEAKRVGSKTLLSQIITMVREAQRSRPPIQRLADKISEYFVPTVIAVAIITFLVWAIWGPEPRLAHGLIYAVSVLIVACPCALGLATPISIIVGVGRGAKMGILIKNAEALETMEKVNVLVVDKTGTLTEGQPGIVNIFPNPEYSKDEILRLAASVEQGSSHPIAKAITREAKKQNSELYNLKEYQSSPGKGIQGILNGRTIIVGNETMMKDHNLTLSEAMSKIAKETQSKAETLIYIGEKDQVIGIISVADLIKKTTPEAIKNLHKMGLEVIMLTGDNEAVANQVARELDIDDYHAGINPQEKGHWIDQLKASGKIVAMAGDGVNDAVALAKADVGIAMGAGSDVAVEGAGITLVKGDLQVIQQAIKLSHLTIKNIWQNLFFAFIYNCLGIPIAAGVLYPFLGITLTPMLAGLAMSLSSVSVIINALRLKTAPVERKK